MKAVLGLLAASLIATPSPAAADAPPAAQVGLASSACGQFLTFSDGDSSPAAWDNVLSFASCMQDRRVLHVEDADELLGMVLELQYALAPSLELYSMAVEQGPPNVKFRAAYHIGLAQVAMMTRARASLASSELCTSLEPLLEAHAELAYYIFTTIHRAGRDEPTLAGDAVTRFMVRSAGEQAAALRTRWSTPPDDDAPRLAFDRAAEQCD